MPNEERQVGESQLEEAESAWIKLAIVVRLEVTNVIGGYVAGMRQG